MNLPNMPSCMEILRGRRTTLLKDSDWTLMPDSPLSDEKKKEWETYRQALRDLPANNPDPQREDGDNTKLPDITWPTKPE